jgi:SAV_6107-like HEPN
MGSTPTLFAVDAATTEAAGGVAAPPPSRWTGARPTDVPTVPAHAFPHRTPHQLLAIARRGLDEADEQRVDGLRYATAHLAALRAAAAVVAARAKPVPSRRSKLTSVWDLLALVAPELGEWAAYFAASAAKRAAAEAGILRVVSTREADELVRAAASFVAVVELTLGLVHPGLLDELVA